MDSIETIGGAERKQTTSSTTVSQSEKAVSNELDLQIEKIRDLKVSEKAKQDELNRLRDVLRHDAIERLDELIESKKQTKDQSVQNTKNIDRHSVANSLRKMTLAAKKGIEVNSNKKTQIFIEKLAEKELNDGELVTVFQTLHEYLLGSKEIVLSTNEQTISEFENIILQIEQTNPELVQKIIDSLVDKADVFGLGKTELRRKFGRLITMLNESQDGGGRMDQVMQEYFINFTEKQKQFIRVIHSPDLFLKLISEERELLFKNSNHIENNIRETYFRIKKKYPDTETLKSLVERQIDVKVSELISDNIVDVLNQLYSRLNIEAANKTTEEVENEDYIYGITSTKNRLFKALQGLKITFEEMESNNPKDPRLIKLFKLTEEDKQTMEIDYGGSKRPVPRIKPLPYYKKVNLSDFMLGQISNFGHWREKALYLHDVNYIYSHPPQEGIFYKGLGGYAEKIGGVDIDGIMNLPDGALTIKAFHLYDKFLEEEMAKVDYRIDATMFSKRFEEISSQLEEKITEYLRLEYGNEISKDRLLSGVRSGVGLAQGIFLTQPEKLSYCDPTDHKGRGAFQSYGTNDAGSVNALNPLHTIMRWQSDANLQQVFFLPIDGKPFSFVPGKNYDHRIAWDNAKKYRESFFNLEFGREGSHRNLIIDKILNLTKTAGIYQRGGWRDFYQFESHFVYNENKDGINLLDSFKSMDIIGYEAVAWYLRNIDNPNYTIQDKTYLEKIDNGVEAKQRETLFKHIHDHYFKPFSEQSYEEYIQILRVKAEENVKKNVIDKKNMAFNDYDKAVQKEISDLFIKGTISRFVAARFPTKFLRIDRDRFNSDGKSRWRKTYEDMKGDYKDLTLDTFSDIMKDLEFAEELLRSNTSESIQESIHLLDLIQDPNRRLGDHADLLYNLDEKTVRRLLTSKKLSKERIDKAVNLYTKLRSNFIGDVKFLDGEAAKAIEDYPFSFGVENTDMKLIAYRSTGPRMVARQIKDIAAMEETVVKGFMGLPDLFKEVALTGNFSKVVEHLKHAQKVIIDVNGRDSDYEYISMVAGMLINYMRKDDSAQLFGGLAGTGTINSIAGEIAGNSNLVREWDARDIDKFCNVLQANGLLPKNNFDKTFGPEYENIWKINRKTKKPTMTGLKQIKEKYKWNIKRLRKQFGGDWKAMGFEMGTNIFPLLILFILWQYIKKAFEETFGAKKG